MQIKRRVPVCNADGRAIPGRFKSIVEEAEVVHMNRRSAMVRLANGDVILRKKKDLIMVEEVASNDN